jgi:DNA polymerase phi
MDDDAMFRADALLTAVLSQTKAAKGGQKAGEEALTHFKFRVLTLLDVYVRIQRASPLLPQMLLPLLRAMFAAQGAPDCDALSARMAALLQAVCKAPCVATEAETLRAHYAFCFRAASRSPLPAVAKAAQACCLYLLRLLRGCAPADVGLRLCAAVDDYLASKRCRLPHAFLVAALSRFPGDAGEALRQLAAWLQAQQGSASLSARAEFLSLEALKMQAAALAHKPSSAAAASVAQGLPAAEMLQGLASALALRLGKPKRQTELYRLAAALTASLHRLCAAQGVAVPAGPQRMLQAAATAAQTAAPLPPPHAIEQLLRIAAAGGAAAATAKKKSARPTEGQEAGEKRQRREAS